MGIFESIKNAIFGHATATPPPAAAASAAAPAATTGSATANATAAVAAAPAPATANELNTQLNNLNAKSTQKLNWQTSIVDLMKLVGLDPSLTNRKQLAQELGYTGDTADSATMNIWLHKQVMDKLAQSGGQVPASLRA